jgi:hypothetical protein
LRWKLAAAAFSAPQQKSRVELSSIGRIATPAVSEHFEEEFRLRFRRTQKMTVGAIERGVGIRRPSRIGSELFATCVNAPAAQKNIGNRRRGRLRLFRHSFIATVPAPSWRINGVLKTQRQPVVRFAGVASQACLRIFGTDRRQS